MATKTKTSTKFDLKTEAVRPLFAYVGATDLAVEAVRDYVADVQKRFTAASTDVQKTVADFDAKSLREQAVKTVTARVEELQKDAKARRTEIEKRIVELRKDAEALPTRVQKSVDENVKVVGDTYGDLVKRGESLVGRIRNQASTKEAVKDAKTTVAKAKTTATQAKKAVDAEVTATKKTVTAAANTAKKAAKKAPARKAPTKKTATAERSAKATVTAAKKTASATAKAVVDAAEKIGD